MTDDLEALRAEVIRLRAQVAAAEKLAEAVRRLILNLDEGDFISTTRIDAAQAALDDWRAAR